MNDQCGLVIVQRDEGLLLRLNAVYHLSLGVGRIVIVDNQSTDGLTQRILRELALLPQVEVLYDNSDCCDQARLANWGLAALLDTSGIEWVLPCDADEFLWCAGDLGTFLAGCRSRGTFYGTLQWRNHVPEQPSTVVDPLSYLRGGLFYEPFVERPWQKRSHFRKALCYRHAGMEIVVGGHYFRREVNYEFFSALPFSPVDFPGSLGLLFHFEMRDCAGALLRKWRQLSTRHVASGVQRDGPWREKEAWMAQLWRRYSGAEDQLFKDFTATPRTLWGTSIPPDRLSSHAGFTEAFMRAIQQLGHCDGTLPPHVL